MVTEKPEQPHAEDVATPPYLVEATSSGQVALVLAMMALGLLILIGLMIFG